MLELLRLMRICKHLNHKRSKLKIDRSFIRDVAFCPDDAAIATAIISLSKGLNLKVLAEGVENESQLAFLREHACDEFQCYYFSRPLAVEDAARKLEQCIRPEQHKLI